MSLVFRLLDDPGPQEQASQISPELSSTQTATQNTLLLLTSIIIGKFPFLLEQSDFGGKSCGHFFVLQFTFPLPA